MSTSSPTAVAPLARWTRLAISSALLAAAPVALAASDCAVPMEGGKQLLWGDLHAHTAWSLDAYAFGAIATPRDAYAFARGQPLRLASGEQVVIDRPLDFAAVTDHAETFDVMYRCTDPEYLEVADCQAIRDGHRNRSGRGLFIDYLLPIVTEGQAPRLCADEPAVCAAASRSQWRRVQEAANAANEPCRFTALIGYEWSASPAGRHWHRNVVFRSDKVPEQAFDFLRYPTASALWTALDRTCRPEQGCDVLAIPHNINWADGGGFDVARRPADELALRARFERLVEIHQEKGNSECLPADPEDSGPDCAFERLTANAARDHAGGDDPRSAAERWQQARSSYYRSLLARGLSAFDASGREHNPLMLGAIGSTDNHLGTPGRVQEDGYWGAMSMLWQDDEARLGYDGYNPGGLVAVWADRNTRAGVFDALQRREAYATSGPRISLRFDALADTTGGASCTVADEIAAPMGGSLDRRREAPRLRILAARDTTPLVRLEVVKVALEGSTPVETVFNVAEFEGGTDAACHVWQDPAFDPEAPALWYARVIEAPTLRWTGHLCRRTGSCEGHPSADRTIRERAWSSPIWYQPGR